MFVGCLQGTGAVLGGTVVTGQVPRGHRAGRPSLPLKYAWKTIALPTARQRSSPRSSVIPGEVRDLKGLWSRLPSLARLLSEASDPTPTCLQEVARWHSFLGIGEALREQGLPYRTDQGTWGVGGLLSHRVEL